ncbi:hypothetical protein TCAL_03793 [Tigriopus californicus]|uniref:DM13 domain-containing protein n=2 Tax=Tigriopus californicus TaxID=6832 RepID=A0A553NVV2_TIGCA|nr:hypothetical protein TCAL_03793 [Tigriopus californicus]|eukprot:TCALIF_03793-PA protein Name:"Similar to Skeletor Protein Skeletor, isoforms D/E (Drosophila melanogaster)" AED:0.26 eAED:0.37 QI:0/-1/0/1/-1/1/1/0/171
MDLSFKVLFVLALPLVLCVFDVLAEKQQVGEFNTIQHGVKGKVYFDGDDKIVIENFQYDGRGPDAYFYVGTRGQPIDSGVRIPYPKGSDAILGEYTGQTINLELPSDVRTSDLRWISVWCRQFGVDFGNLFFDKETNVVAESESEPENAAPSITTSLSVLMVVCQTSVYLF